jgi:metacaspase-1
MDRALLVGINAYPDPNTLHGCVNDVNDVKDYIVNNCNFSADAVTLLLDADATADNIKQQLRNATAGLSDGDRLLFWYSGHGAQLTDGDASTDVICPVDFDFTADKSVTVQDFHDIFSGLNSGVEAVWGSDSCHSGDLEKEWRKASTRVFVGPQGFKPHDPNARGFREISDAMPFIALMSGCQSDQTSADATFNGRSNGAFTYYLLQCLNGGAQSAQLTDLVPQVVTALHNNNFTQTPQLSGPTAEVNRTFLGAAAAPQAGAQPAAGDGSSGGGSADGGASGTGDGSSGGSSDGGSSAGGTGDGSGN